MAKKRKGRPRKDDQCATDIEVSHLYSIDLAGVPGAEAKTARYACNYAAFRMSISPVPQLVISICFNLLACVKKSSS